MFYENYYLVWDSKYFKCHSGAITFYRVKGVHIKYIKTTKIPTLHIIFCSIIILLVLISSTHDRFALKPACSFFQFYAHKVFDYIFRTTLENILLEIVKKVIHLQFSRLVRSSFLGCLQSSHVFQSCGKTSLIQILSNKGFLIFAGSSGADFIASAVTLHLQENNNNFYFL